MTTDTATCLVTNRRLQFCWYNII